MDMGMHVSAGTRIERQRCIDKAAECGELKLRTRSGAQRWTATVARRMDVLDSTREWHTDVRIRAAIWMHDTGHWSDQRA